MKHLEHAAGRMLEFLNELSQSRGQVLLFTVSPLPQPIEEDPQSGIAFSPSRKLVGTGVILI